MLVPDASHIKYRTPPWIFFAPEALENVWTPDFRGRFAREVGIFRARIRTIYR